MPTEPSRRSRRKPPLQRLLFAVVTPVQRFFRTEAAGGIVLIAAAIVALLLASSRFAHAYEEVIHANLHLGAGPFHLELPLHALINDGLMTIFFVVAGMEIKRELVTGELSTLRQASLPLIAAAGGMLLPGLIYLGFNRTGAAHSGWAIPAATDIAFALGCLSLLKRRVPWSLFVFLTALAIFDDLGAILIIALFYGGKTHLPSLLVAGGLTVVLIALGRARTFRSWFFIAVGIALWIAVARSGLHPTIAGVIVGLAMPTRGARPLAEALQDLEIAVESLRQLPKDRSDGSLAAIERHLESLQPPVERALHGLHAPVAFLIVPLFALANAGVQVGSTTPEGTPVTIGVAVGLVAGKALGIFLATFLAVRLGVAPMPSNARWPHVFGVSLMGGIGFTMSLFVTDLAFRDHTALATAAKIGILSGSLISALGGLLILRIAPSCGERLREDVSVFRVDVPRFMDAFRVEPWLASGPLVGSTLGQLNLQRDHGVTVLGVFHEEEDVATADGAHYRKLDTVNADYAITEGDTLLLVGERDRVTRFLAEARRPSTMPPPDAAPASARTA
ncbi:MAG: Na+/H+ antiporter NhaA [Polyangiaceae bacterium]